MQIHERDHQSHIEPSRVIESRESVLEGDFERFLADSFLREYLEKESETDQRIRSLPAVLTGIIQSAASYEHDGERIIQDMYLTSSVARSIAYQSYHDTKNGMPKDFWNLHGYMKSLVTTLGESHKPDVAAFAAGFTNTPIDINIKAVLAQEKNFEQIFSHLACMHDIPGEQITIEEFSDAVIQRTGQRKSFTVEQGPFVLQYSAGVIPTNLYIDRLLVRVFRSDTGENLIDMGITKLPNDTFAIYGDKRAGLTSRKQDMCIAKLTADDGHIRYVFDSDAVDVLKGQDSIDTESTNVSQVMEIFLRALRMNIVHSNDTLTIEKGESLPLPQLDMFLPQFTGHSLFDLRKMVSDIQMRGNGHLPYDNPYTMNILHKELALCLTADPYVTIQALRDSGISRLIPGLRKVTDTKWNEILRSSHLVTIPISPTRVPTRYQRTYEFMLFQRDTYLHGNGKGARLYDGVERFMRALGARQGHEWEAYLALWKKDVPNSSIARGVASQDTLIPAGSALAHIGDYTLMSHTRPLATEEDVRGAITTIRNNIEPELKLADRIADIQDMLRKHHNVSVIRDIFSALSKVSPESEERQKLTERIQSIALVYDILRRTPFGLTPQEMQSLYYTTETQFNKGQFSNIFLDLKLSGLVRRRVTYRITTQRHTCVPGEFYSLLPSDERGLQIEHIAERNDYLKLYTEVLRQRGIPFDQFSLRGYVHDLVAYLRNGKNIELVETLESLTPVDLALLTEMESNDVEKLTLAFETLRETFRLYHLHEYHEDRVVPRVYIDTVFDSPDMREHHGQYEDIETRVFGSIT